MSLPFSHQQGILLVAEYVLRKTLHRASDVNQEPRADRIVLLIACPGGQTLSEHGSKATKMGVRRRTG